MSCVHVVACDASDRLALGVSPRTKLFFFPYEIVDEFDAAQLGDVCQSACGPYGALVDASHVRVVACFFEGAYTRVFALCRASFDRERARNSEPMAFVSARELPALVRGSMFASSYDITALALVMQLVAPVGGLLASATSGRTDEHATAMPVVQHLSSISRKLHVASSLQSADSLSPGGGATGPASSSSSNGASTAPPSAGSTRDAAASALSPPQLPPRTASSHVARPNALLPGGLTSAQQATADTPVAAGAGTPQQLASPPSAMRVNAADRVLHASSASVSTPSSAAASASAAAAAAVAATAGTLSGRSSLSLHRMRRVAVSGPTPGPGLAGAAQWVSPFRFDLVSSFPAAELAHLAYEVLLFSGTPVSAYVERAVRVHLAVPRALHTVLSAHWSSFSRPNAVPSSVAPAALGSASTSASPLPGAHEHAATTPATSRAAAQSLSSVSPAPARTLHASSSGRGVQLPGTPARDAAASTAVPVAAPVVPFLEASRVVLARLATELEAQRAAPDERLVAMARRHCRLQVNALVLLLRNASLTSGPSRDVVVWRLESIDASTTVVCERLSDLFSDVESALGEGDATLAADTLVRRLVAFCEQLHAQVAAGRERAAVPHELALLVYGALVAGAWDASGRPQLALADILAVSLRAGACLGVSEAMHALCVTAAALAQLMQHNTVEPLISLRHDMPGYPGLAFLGKLIERDAALAVLAVQVLAPLQMALRDVVEDFHGRFGFEHVERLVDVFESMRELRYGRRSNPLSIGHVASGAIVASWSRHYDRLTEDLARPLSSDGVARIGALVLGDLRAERERVSAALSAYVPCAFPLAVQTVSLRIMSDIATAVSASGEMTNSMVETMRETQALGSALAELLATTDTPIDVRSVVLPVATEWAQRLERELAPMCDRSVAADTWTPQGGGASGHSSSAKDTLACATQVTQVLRELPPLPHQWRRVALAVAAMLERYIGTLAATCTPIDVVVPLAVPLMTNARRFLTRGTLAEVPAPPTLGKPQAVASLCVTLHNLSFVERHVADVEHDVHVVLPSDVEARNALSALYHSVEQARVAAIDLLAARLLFVDTRRELVDTLYVPVPAEHPVSAALRALDGHLGDIFDRLPLDLALRVARRALGLLCAHMVRVLTDGSKKRRWDLSQTARVGDVLRDDVAAVREFFMPRTPGAAGRALGADEVRAATASWQSLVDVLALGDTRPLRDMLDAAVAPAGVARRELAGALYRSARAADRRHAKSVLGKLP